MVQQYLTASEFTERLIGSLTQDLGAGVLNKYLLDASAFVDETANWTFARQQALSETLLTTSMRQALIEPSGFARLQPAKGHPITAVSSLTYQARGFGSLGSTTTVPVDASNVVIDQDASGDGWSILVFQDFSAYRTRRAVLQFNVVYNAGYAVGSEPQWLKAATLHAAAFLLKSRQEVQVIVGDDGGAAGVDTSMTGGHLSKMKSYLKDHMRVF